MDIKKYIESGIVGSYVLGLASESEKQEFETLCGQYPKLVEAKRSFELALEAQLMSEAVPPPSDLKEKVLLSINTNGVSGLHKAQRDYSTPLRKINVWKMIAAACIILLCGSVYFAYSIMEKYEKLHIAYTRLENGLELSIHADAIVRLSPILEKPSTKWSAMLEPENSSHCLAHVYWDSLTANTFLLIGNIPKPIADKQFQLWALFDNDSIDLGVFDSKKEGQLIQMKNINKAKIFVITTEQKGGSSAPSMQSLYAVGKL